jgi:site-specific recombinase XerC
MASVRERKGPHGTRFVALYRDDEGRQRSAGSFSTRKAAEKAGARAELVGRETKARILYRTEDTKSSRLTLFGYQGLWLSGHRMEATTRQSYAWALDRYLIPRFGQVVLSKITSADVRMWFRELERQGKSGSVLDKVRMVGSGMLATAIEDGLATVNPFRGQRIVPAPRRQDRFPVKPYTKNQDRREVKISASLADAIRKVKTDGYLFRAVRGGNIARGYFHEAVWVPSRAKAGLEKLRVHDLRHSHASWLLASGCDVATVAERLGHHDINTTARYLHAMRDSGDRAVTALESYLSNSNAA